MIASCLDFCCHCLERCHSRLTQSAASSRTRVCAGVVQTAYANGASTAYMQDHLQLPLRLAKTGVKHLHAAALQFDIGVYFEANGHGSITFSSEFHDTVASMLTSHQQGNELLAAAQLAALQQLQSIEQVTNPAIGDAMSGMLLAAAILRLTGMSMQQWAQLFQPLHARLATLRVADRYAISTDSCETRVTAPAALQGAIDAAVQRTEGGRAFVRPSGTEDVVRVYAEAPTKDAAGALCLEAMQAVYRHANGTGSEPSLPS